MKKTLTKASSKKKFPLRAPRLPWPSTDRGTKPIKYITKKNGQLETKEERKKRLAEKEALTLRVFQMFYDADHKPQKGTKSTKRKSGGKPPFLTCSLRRRLVLP
jgi:hypothetical protein